MSEDNSAIYRRVEMDDRPSGLKRHLMLNYPGCKSIQDAVQMILSEKNNKQNITASQSTQIELADKLKQVQDIVAEKYSLIEAEKIPQITREKLALMPLDSIQTIRAWGIAWLEAIKKAGL